MKRILIGACFALLLMVVLLAVINLTRQPVRPLQAEWGQGYESPKGYMQPDHGAFYYWWMTRVLLSDMQPSYHVYVVPPGYPVTYRPWTPQYAPTYQTRQPAPQPPTGLTASPRTSGGFSGYSQPASPSPRTSGGFSSRPVPAPSSPRTSGGFSRPSPSPSPRSSGGFSGSSSRPSSSPRSSGGFGGKGK